MAPDFVKLPVEDHDSDIHLALVNSSLTDLKSKCELFIFRGRQHATRTHGAAAFWFRDAISRYNDNAAKYCNFDVIQNHDEILVKLIRLLPQIIDHALNLSDHIQREGEICILKRGINKVNVLSRNLICSLIANGFLCTLPSQNEGRRLPYFNFYRLFDEGPEESRTNVKGEKVKCFLEYFEQMGNGSLLPDTVHSFERYHNSTQVDWENSPKLLSTLRVTATERIEDATDMLQVDFANETIGGGVLCDGCVQEEIRFCINPELIVARLFTERLESNEVLIMTGSRQFSSYHGYGHTFKFAKLPVNAAAVQVQQDFYGRERTQIVAMDALNFRFLYQMRGQYTQDRINRELHKSYVAFRPGNFVTPIATGNWGCGSFNGDPELKFLIQWMAATENGRRPVLYHARDDAQRNELEEMRAYLERKQVTVGQLYSTMINYNGQTMPGVFRYIRRMLGN